MLILLDQDGVLADFHAGFLDAWSARRPDYKVPALEERRSFYMRDEFPAHMADEVEDVYTSAGFFRDLPPVPGAIEAVRQLADLGHDIRICTSPILKYRHCLPEKYEWIERYLGVDFVPRMILTRDKTLVHGDVLVDDNPAITGSRTPDWQHIIFDQPYNRMVAGLRMDWSNWQDILEKEHQHGGT